MGVVESGTDFTISIPIGTISTASRKQNVQCTFRCFRKSFGGVGCPNQSQEVMQAQVGGGPQSNSAVMERLESIVAITMGEKLAKCALNSFAKEIEIIFKGRINERSAGTDK